MNSNKAYRLHYAQPGWGQGGNSSSRVKQLHGWDAYTEWAKELNDEDLAAYFGPSIRFVEADGVKYPVAVGIADDSANMTTLKAIAFSDSKGETDTASAGNYSFTTSGYYKMYAVSEGGWSLDYNTVTGLASGNSVTVTVKPILGGDDLTRTVTVS